ncbi:hypothetical protein L915_14105, partial [Phytophthora nicotianae]
PPTQQATAYLRSDEPQRCLVHLVRPRTTYVEFEGRCNEAYAVNRQAGRRILEVVSSGRLHPQREVPKIPGRCPQDWKIGIAAEVDLLGFLRSLDITVRGAHNVLEAMRKLHKSGRLNDRITRYKHPGRIADPAPAHTTNILGLV